MRKDCRVKTTEKKKYRSKDGIIKINRRTKPLLFECPKKFEWYKKKGKMLNLINSKSGTFSLDFWKKNRKKSNGFLSSWYQLWRKYSHLKTSVGNATRNTKQFDGKSSWKINHEQNDFYSEWKIENEWMNEKGDYSHWLKLILFSTFFWLSLCVCNFILRSSRYRWVYIEYFRST